MKTYSFKPGWYYIGDPCYAVKNTNWMPLLEKSNYFDCPSQENPDGKNQWYGEYNEQPMFAAGTACGDGCYTDQAGREYGVDAGLIGIIPIGAADGDSMHGGEIIEFETDFEVSAEDGYFKFGHVVIETRDVCEVCGEADPRGDCCCPECGERYARCRCGEDEEWECGYCGDPDCCGECEEDGEDE